MAKRKVGKKNKLVVIGETEEGNLVVGNVFILCESRGLPLEIAIHILEEKGCVVSWIDFYEDSMNAMWKPETTLEKIKSALDETHGHEYSRQVILRLKRHMASKHR